MNIYTLVLTQLQQSRSALYAAFGILAVVFAVVIAVHLGFEVSFARLSRDPAAILMAPVYIGLLSNLGVVFWSAAAAVCFFGALVCDQRAGGVRGFLIASGSLTVLLMLDDLFLFHEVIFPKYFGIREKWVMISYMALLAVILVKYHRVILNTKYVVLALSLVFFMLSIFFDKVFTMFGEIHLLEDGAKFCGIVIWMVYFVIVSSSAPKRLVSG